MHIRLITGLFAGLAATTASLAAPLGTAFTYQGQLKQDGAPMSGDVDFVFRLFDAETNGAQTGANVVRNDVAVVNGLFTVELDFGVAAFAGEASWLDVTVGGTPLSPRQPLVAAPYALHARTTDSNWVDDGDNVILPVGNVGMGTDEPTAMLHLHRPYASTAMRFQSLRFDQGAPVSAVRGLTSAATSGEGQPWTNPGAALATNDVWATTSLSHMVGKPDGNQSRFLDLSAPGFALPAAAQVTGITVQAEGHVSSNCTDCERSQLTVVAELLGGSAQSSQRGFSFGPSDTTVAAGGSVDNWGNDWTAAQVNSPSFGVRLSANLVVGETFCFPPFGCGLVPCDCTGTGTGFIDAVTITVFYFDAPTTSSPVNWSLGVSGDDKNFRIAPTPDVSAPIVVVTPQGSVGIGTTEFSNGFFKLAVNGPAAKTTAGSWSALSDARVKRNVEPLRGALARMLSLRGVSFEFTEEGLRTGLASPGRHMGLLAQEVEAVFPEWVAEAPSGYKFVTEAGTTALLVEALRELRSEKDAEIADLKERLARLEALLLKVSNQSEEKP